MQEHQMNHITTIKNAMKRKDVDTAGLAYCCGLTRAHVHNILKGIAPLTVETASAIGKALTINGRRLFLQDCASRYDKQALKDAK